MFLQSYRTKKKKNCMNVVGGLAAAGEKLK